MGTRRRRRRKRENWRERREKYKNTGNKVGNDKTDKIYDVHRNDG
jgi:hypothetical protein